MLNDDYSEGSDFEDSICGDGDYSKIHNVVGDINRTTDNEWTKMFNKVIEQRDGFDDSKCITTPADNNVSEYASDCLYLYILS